MKTVDVIDTVTSYAIITLSRMKLSAITITATHIHIYI